MANRSNPNRRLQFFAHFCEGVGAGVALAAALPYYGGYGYGYESCVQWVPDYGWVNVCNYPSYGGYGYY
ncbi:MAG: hypothetical protein WCF72_03220 [Pseudolabrys sp.]